MALEPNELFASNTVGPDLRFFPEAGSIQPKTFAAGAITLLKGTPIAFDSVALTWKIWEDSGANETGIIRGFVWPDDVKLEAGGEVLGQVFMKGRLHAADVVLPAGELQAGLDANLQLGLRERGFIVEGLEKFR